MEVWLGHAYEREGLTEIIRSLLPHLQRSVFLKDGRLALARSKLEEMKGKKKIC